MAVYGPSRNLSFAKLLTTLRVDNFLFTGKRRAPTADPHKIFHTGKGIEADNYTYRGNGLPEGIETGKPEMVGPITRNPITWDIDVGEGSGGGAGMTREKFLRYVLHVKTALAHDTTSTLSTGMRRSRYYTVNGHAGVRSCARTVLCEEHSRKTCAPLVSVFSACSCTQLLMSSSTQEAPLIVLLPDKRQFVFATTILVATTIPSCQNPPPETPSPRSATVVSETGSSDSSCRRPA